MFKYCVISSRQGGGVGLLKKAIPGSLVVMLVLSFFAFATKINAAESGSYDTLNLDAVGEVLKDITPTDLFNTGTNLPLNLPLNPLNHIKGFGISGLDTDTTDLDLTRFFSPSGVSTGDLVGILKGVAVLSIQIFIVVIQVVSGIVKGIMGAFN